MITFTGLVPGSYEFRFEDRFGCVINGKFVIEQSFKATAIQFSCSPDAEVTFFLEGGNPPYTSNDPNVTQFNSEFFLIYDLDPGLHSFSFTDSDGCIAIASLTIPEELSAEVVNI